MPNYEKLMRQRSDPAVLASNYEERLEELENNEMVTHRSSRSWSSVQSGLDAHGHIPVYYRLDGMITHTGFIIEMVVDPDGASDVPDVIRDNITEEDTYSDFNNKYDTTTYLVTDGQRLADPFPQSDLERLAGGEYIDEDYTYQPAYVRQRDGDFPDF
ncbi:MAG: hypothetical protein ACOCYZ_03435 [Halococcoides sp.]